MLLQPLQNSLLRHAKLVMAFLFALLSLLLYLTSLLSKSTALSGTFVDIAIYTIYILLVFVLVSMTFVVYCYFQEDNLCVFESDKAQNDGMEIENLLEQNAAGRVEPQQKMEDSDEMAKLVMAKERLLSASQGSMHGVDAVESADIEEITAYLSQQHLQITAVIVLLMAPEKAVAVLEQCETSLRTSVLTALEELQSLSPEAVTLLDKALVKEFLPIEEECLRLQALASAEIRALLKHVDKKELMFALNGATQELQEKFFVNMSAKAAAEFKEALRSLSRIDATKRQNAVRNIALLAQRLRDNGKIRVRTL